MNHKLPPNLFRSIASETAYSLIDMRDQFKRDRWQVDDRGLSDEEVEAIEEYNYLVGEEDEPQ
jgi:hypothetical protein